MAVCVCVYICVCVCVCPSQRVATLLNPKTNRGMVELARLFYCAAVADQNPVVEVPMRHRKGSKKGSRNGSATDNGATKMGLRTLLMQYLRENKDLAFGLGKSPLGQIVFALRIWSVMHPHALTVSRRACAACMYAFVCGKWKDALP